MSKRLSFKEMCEYFYVDVLTKPASISFVFCVLACVLVFISYPCPIFYFFAFVGVLLALLPISFLAVFLVGFAFYVFDVLFTLLFYISDRVYGDTK